MSIRKLIAAALLAGCGTTANAGIVRINFEDLAAGTSVTSQYAALGATFSTIPIVDANGFYRNSVDVVSNQLGDFGANAGSLWQSVTAISFAEDVSNFSVLIGDTEAGSLLASLWAFDAKGNQIGFVSRMTGSYNTPWFYQETLSVNVGGIRRIEFRSDADGAVFDNITFAKIPAPGAASLLCAGLLGAARRRRA